MVMEVMNFPIPRATVKFSSPVVHRATARGTRWKASPAPRVIAMMPNKVYSLFPLALATIRIPMVMTEIR